MSAVSHLRFAACLLLGLAVAGCDSGGTTAELCGGSLEVGKVDVVVGTSNEEAGVSSIITATYAGRLQNGDEFDSGRLVDYPLSNSVAGFRLGIAGMKTGGRRTITIPPDLGYGASDARSPQTGEVLLNEAGTPLIPACSTLIFDVTLEGVRPGTAQPGASNG